MTVRTDDALWRTCDLAEELAGEGKDGEGGVQDLDLGLGITVVLSFLLTFSYSDSTKFQIKAGIAGMMR